MESRVSRLEQQVETHEGDIRRFAPIMVEVAENRVRMEQMKHGLDSAIQELKDFRLDQERREEGQRKERKRDRWAMVGTVLTTGMLIVAAIGLLVPTP